ncbi:MAG: hypothetical protein GX493_10320 [Firmicutes bacterium]|nr:hypothetical protein [Bacillota bacterium]
MHSTGERTVLVLLEEAPGGEDHLLTYLLPSSLAPEVVPGCRVVVPFRGRRSAGIVLALDVPVPSTTELRQVASVLDPEPVVGGFRAVLAEWLAARYLALRSETYRLFLPPGTPRKRKRLLHLAVPWPRFRQRLERFILPPEDRERVLTVLAPLAARDRAPETIREGLGALSRLLEILLGEGYLVWREPWQRSGPAARQVTFLRLSGKPPWI